MSWKLGLQDVDFDPEIHGDVDFSFFSEEEREEPPTPTPKPENESGSDNVNNAGNPMFFLNAPHPPDIKISPSSPPLRGAQGRAGCDERCVDFIQFLTNCFLSLS
jgi:hypothetical protein